MERNYFSIVREDTSCEVIKTPEGYDEPPNKLFCTKCQNIVKGTYRKKITKCQIFLINCCTIKTDIPKISCSRCNFAIKGLSFVKCNKCGISMNFNFKFCPKCGTPNKS